MNSYTAPCCLSTIPSDEPQPEILEASRKLEKCCFIAQKKFKYQFFKGRVSRCAWI